VPRTLFEDFSLPHANSDFYLRPDHILALFEIDTSRIPSRAGWYQHDLDLEVELDIELEKEIDEVQVALKASGDRVEELVASAGIEIDGVESEGEEGEEEGEEEAGIDFDHEIGGSGKDIEMISNNPIRNIQGSPSKHSETLSKNSLTPTTPATTTPHVRDFSAFQSTNILQMKAKESQSSSPPRPPSSTSLLRKPTFSDASPDASPEIEVNAVAVEVSGTDADWGSDV
jgi:hypothetical protein